MSINVEMIGETLMIQQYVGEITEPHLCRMVSLSDAFTPNGRTKVNVLWELSVKPISSTRCEYTNSVAATPTEEFLDFIKRHGISFEQAAAARQAAGGDHNRRETPLFAESIARRALARSPFEGSLGSRRSPPSDRSRSLDTAEAFTVDIKFVKAEKPLWMSASRLTIVRRTHGFLLNMTRHDSRVAKHSGQNKGAAAAGNGQRPMERNPT